MIADLKNFIEKERPYWQKLEFELKRITDGVADLSDLAYAKTLLSLFQRTSSDLARIQGFSAEPELRGYLENLVGTAYAEIHSVTRDSRGFRPWQWLTQTFPQTFRRQIWGFNISFTLTLVGALVGALLLMLDLDNRRSIYAFSYLADMTPRERVSMEETPVDHNRIDGHQATFSAQLMQNNITVSFFALALGSAWGLGTVVLLFFNGVQVGGVIYDYVQDGQSMFVAGWLLPHGSFEIPAILIAGQAGMILGRAIIGWGTAEDLRGRLRLILPEVATLAGGASVMLVWAGIVESFFSQYHAPIVPYSVKISFGTVELISVIAFFSLSGRKKEGAL